MRTRFSILVGLTALAVLGAGFGSPAQAKPYQKFEAKLAFPAADAAPLVSHEVACPDAGDLDGTFYKFFDLKGDYKHFKVAGPKHLFDEPEPVGIHNINDYDIDIYVYDAKCNDITPAFAAPWAGTHAGETKKPIRYAIVTYWSGIHPNLPITLEVSHTKIK